MTLGTLFQLAAAWYVVQQAPAVWRCPNRYCLHDGLQHSEQAVGVYRQVHISLACCYMASH
jgi:hypothetical protein